MGAKKDNPNPRDYDLIIPFSKWFGAAMLIPPDAVPNTFGGWKCKTSEGIEVDVWPGELSHLLQFGMCKVAWFPKSDIRWIKE